MNTVYTLTKEECERDYEPSYLKQWTFTKTIAIPDNITKIGNYAFSCCLFSSFVVYQPEAKISELEPTKQFPKVETIGKFAFACCKNIENLVFQDGLISIKDYAFANDENLKFVKIPQTVKEVEQHAFLNCNRELAIIIPYKNERLINHGYNIKIIDMLDSNDVNEKLEKGKVVSLGEMFTE